MTDLRQALYTFLDSKTAFTVINAMAQYEEPATYVSFYVLSDELETTDQGNRVYDAIDDIFDVTYSPMPLATIQLDIRGAGSYTEARNLFYGMQIWQNDMKAQGLHFRGTGNISTIPNVQNGYVKEGYQFNLFVAFDTSIVSTIDRGEILTWQ